MGKKNKGFYGTIWRTKYDGRGPENQMAKAQLQDGKSKNKALLSKPKSGDTKNMTFRNTMVIQMELTITLELPGFTRPCVRVKMKNFKIPKHMLDVFDSKPSKDDFDQSQEVKR